MEKWGRPSSSCISWFLEYHGIFNNNGQMRSPIVKFLFVSSKVSFYFKWNTCKVEASHHQVAFPLLIRYICIFNNYDQFRSTIVKLLSVPIPTHQHRQQSLTINVDHRHVAFHHFLIQQYLSSKTTLLGRLSPNRFPLLFKYIQSIVSTIMKH